MWQGCAWLNEPAVWGIEAGDLTVTTRPGSDFWRGTHYGFSRHSGHFFAAATPSSFTATVRVRASFSALYDQAGLMVLIDEAHWVKAGVEISDGQAQLSSVLTIGQSDWAVGAYAGDPGDFWLRATIDAGVLRMQASADGLRWPLLRLCPFPKAASFRVGPMCCTPERAGLEVRFSDFTVTPPIARALHDLS